MRFLWYIVNLEDATVSGTNDLERVARYKDDEDLVVIHKDGGKYWSAAVDDEDIMADEDLDEEEESDDESDDPDAS